MMPYNITTPSVSTVLNTFVTTRGFLSDEGARIILIIYNVFLGPALAVFGMVANIINMIVYSKQVGTETTAISFVGLSVSDFCTLVTYFMTCLGLNPWIDHSFVPVFVKQVCYYFVSVLTVVFFRISCWITIFITLDRCLRVAVPTEAKQIITPKRARVIIASIFLAPLLFYVVPMPFSVDMTWYFDPSKNKTVMTLGVTENMGVNMFNYNKDMVMLWSSFLSLILITTVLVVQLKRAAKRRMSTTCSATSRSNSVPVKEKRVMVMVCLITTIFITCFLPDIILVIVYLVENEFQAGKRYENLVNACWSFAFACHALNACANIFVYYRMSSRYRCDFKAMNITCS